MKKTYVPEVEYNLLTKPFNSDQLKVQLENLLHQRVLLREHYMKHSSETEIRFHLNVTDKGAEFLNKVRSIIEEGLGNSDFKVENIYKRIGMGRNKFFDKLKGLTGQSPIDMVREYRLNKAITLLQSGNYNVTYASYWSGFTDAGYFSKCFKERFGVSPTHYGKKG
jgi:AraC-like DNA-binding protein